MADAGTSGLVVPTGRRMQVSRRKTGFRTGDVVRVKEHRRSPLGGQPGWITEVTPGDPFGPFLVRFGNGLQFRYRGDELVALTS